MSSADGPNRTDAILPMTNDYMQQIVRREKKYEFRRYRIRPSVKRIWFYLNAPFSGIAYVCEIDSAQTRNLGDPPLPEDGLGNKEYNERHKDWDGYDFAYRIRSVWRIKSSVTLRTLKEKYGMKGQPRGLVYTPVALMGDVPWDEQDKVWAEKDRFEQIVAKRNPLTTTKATHKRKTCEDSTPSSGKTQNKKLRWWTR